MDRLIEALKRPEAYPGSPENVEVRQTHISVVFLAGQFAYKVKKPLAFEFLDFSTLAKRLFSCQEEIRLNRRLASHVYLGLVPIVLTAAGIQVEGEGQAIEWAVKMERLPGEATLQDRLLNGELDAELVAQVARKIAGFHREAERGPRIFKFGRWEVVARNTLENFEQSAAQVELAVHPEVFKRVRALTAAALDHLDPLIESRAFRGVPCDTHGDLRLEHVYSFPDRQPPDDVVILDCIEFNERFRFADPVSDIAFLAMDLAFHGRRDLAAKLTDAYFTAAQDDEGRLLLSFYTAYRAMVRAKVERLLQAEPDVSDPERNAALARARRYWLLALGELEHPSARPGLVLVGGLPGTGKSTLAARLAQRCGFELIRSDLVRKDLAGLAPAATATAPFAEGIYTPAWNQRTYEECLHRAESLLLAGKRAMVDASFGQEDARFAFIEMADRLGVPVLFLLCRAPPAVACGRLQRRRNNVSDADAAIYEQASKRWEPIGPGVRRSLADISTDAAADQIELQASDWIRNAGLL